MMQPLSEKLSETPSNEIPHHQEEPMDRREHRRPRMIQVQLVPDDLVHSRNSKQKQMSQITTSNSRTVTQVPAKPKLAIGQLQKGETAPLTLVRHLLTVMTVSVEMYYPLTRLELITRDLRGIENAHLPITFPYQAPTFRAPRVH